MKSDRYLNGKKKQKHGGNAFSMSFKWIARDLESDWIGTGVGNDIKSCAVNLLSSIFKSYKGHFLGSFSHEDGQVFKLIIKKNGGHDKVLSIRVYDLESDSSPDNWSRALTECVLNNHNLVFSNVA